MILQRKSAIALMLMLASVLSISSVASEQPFNAAALMQLKNHYQGKPWLMLLWSVDCPPCMKELALLQRLSQQYDGLSVVIINSDDFAEVSEQRSKILSDFQLSKLNNYYFAPGQAMRNRYLIDPSWYGELPRSYFVEPSGKFHGKSGLIDEQLLIAWLTSKDMVASRTMAAQQSVEQKQ